MFPLTPRFYGPAIVLSMLLSGCGGDVMPSPDTSQEAVFTVSGIVTDLEGTPVVDVFVTVSTEFCIPDRTDEEGGFQVKKVTAGPKRLVTYGETASSALVASVSFGFEAEGQHVFEAPIRLPRLDERWPIVEESPEEQVITTDDGLTLTILPAALKLAPFAPAELQVARVPLADAPAFVPVGVELVDLFVLHPILSTLSPPAPLAFPDDTGLSPGTRVSFHALDYESGQLIPVASGEVDETGRPRTDDGEGISELTWVGLSVEVE